MTDYCNVEERYQQGLAGLLSILAEMQQQELVALDGYEQVQKAVELLREHGSCRVLVLGKWHPNLRDMSIDNDGVLFLTDRLRVHGWTEHAPSEWAWHYILPGGQLGCDIFHSATGNREVVFTGKPCDCFDCRHFNRQRKVGYE